MTAYYPPDEEVHALTGWDITKGTYDPTTLYATTVFVDFMHLAVLRVTATNQLAWIGNVKYGTDTAAIRAAQTELKSRMQGKV